MKRVYYSGYIPVTVDNRLPAITAEVPVLRENRLYQSDWLMRFYGFKADEILDSGVDSDGVAQFISVLYNTVHERNGNELGIYLISHKLADVSVNWTHEITIEKKGMFSNIKKN